MSSENIIQEAEAGQEQSFSIKFIDPEAIVEKIELMQGAVVADFGCGGGYFSLPIAKKIGEQGVVYALDILPQSLETVTSQAKTAGLTNIVTKRANLEKVGGSRLPDNSCDWVIIKDMLFQNKNKVTILQEGRRILKDGGKILLIEWNLEDASIGPDRSLRVSKEELFDLIQQSALSLANEIQVSDFHYCLVLVK